MNRYHPKISIITVCFNASNCIESTIKSVLCQDYFNIEYIVIDGKSTDGTIEIINRYKTKIDVIISESDNGIYDAMNKGLELATGDFVNFLNSGDSFCAENTISYLVQNINNDTKIISGDFKIVKPNGDINLINTKQINWTYLKKDFYACHQAIFINKDVASIYDLSFKIKADYKWVLDALSKTDENQVIKINYPIVNYDSDGFSAQNPFKNLFELMKLQRNYFGFTRLILNFDVYIYRLLRDLKSNF